MKELSKKIYTPYFSVISFILIIKIALIVGGVLVITTFPFVQKNYEANFHLALSDNQALLLSKTWDSQHYLNIAKNGYKINSESNPFFPLYPFLISGVNYIIHSPAVSGLFLSLIFSVGSGILLFKLAKHISNDEGVSFLSVVFLFSFPTAFFLSLIYSESLFLFLALLFFYNMEKKNFWIAMLPAFLLPLTRPTGIFIIVPLFLYMFLLSKKDKKIKIPTFNKPITLNFKLHYLFLIFPILGIIAYLLLMQIFLNNPFVTLLDKNRIAIWDIRNVIDPSLLIKNLFMQDLRIHGIYNSILDRVFFISFCVFLPFIYKKVSLPIFVFTVLLGITPLFGSFMSYLRYILPAFSVFIVIAMYCKNQKLDTIKYALLFFFILLQAILFSMHILNYWVA